MKKALSLFIVITVAVFSVQMKVTAAQPSGTVAATPLTVFWATPAVNCYDANGTLLSNTPAGSGGAQSITPLNTAWITSGAYLFPLWDNTKPATCNYTQYWEPFLSTSYDTVYNEPVYLSGNGKTARLLFPPKNGQASIISMKSFDATKTYVQGTDYTLSGRTITQVGTNMSYKATATVKSGLNYIQGSWVNVTYIADKSGWKGPVFTSKASLMPKTMAKLNAKTPVNIVAYGMSITAGQNVSGCFVDKNSVLPTAPYMRGYIEMLQMQLKNKFGGTINMYNMGCPGRNAAWAETNAATLVNPLNPDLVIIDMGMNDIYNATQYNGFKTSIQNTMNTIKGANPNVEFILIGNLLPDPSYNTWYVGTPTQTAAQCLYYYESQYKAMETTGVVNLDMTAMSDSICKRKAIKDIMTNELHPNDYIARWYTHGLFALFGGGTPTEIEPASQASVASSFLSVTPNPVVDGHFILKIADDVVAENAIISVYDLTGKQVASFKQSSSAKDYLSSDLNMSTGVYIFKAQVDGKVSTQKVVVK
jgi:lysophospholipase L1-like esterase